MSNQDNIESIDDIFSTKPDKDQLELIDEIIDLHVEIEMANNVLEKKQKELNEKIAILKDQWQKNQITEMKKGIYNLKLVPIDKWSIKKPDMPNNDEDFRSDRIKEMAPFFDQCGYPKVYKVKAYDIHHKTLDTTIKKIIENELYTPDQIIEQFPFVRHHEDQTIKIKEIKK